MVSKLSQYCDGVLEASWIASILLTPIFFNILSSRIFEPDKIAILRSLALIMLGAWLIKLIDQGGFDFRKTWKSIRSVPLLVPVLLLALIYIVSTILSITPWISFFGSYPRLQGTYTFFSYLVIFVSILGTLRRKEQLERLFTVVILASLPVSLYGILQRYGLDPIPWGGNVQNRISANMGNSIFLAAYLIMVIPIAIGKIVLVFQQILREDTHVFNNIARATTFIFILLLDLIAVYLSGSRGPVLGLITGIFLLSILFSIYWQKRWLLAAALITACISAVGLLVLNLPGGPLSDLRESPWLGRFGKLVDMEQRTSQVRSLIWEGASELVSIHPPLEYPDGRKDYFNVLRPLLGYGPESMYVAYNRFFPPELAQIEKRNASPDRSHNESWDALVTTGIFGFIVYQVLFISSFYHGLIWLGLISRRKYKVLYFLLVIGGGIIGGWVVSLWLGSGFLGVGIPFGLIAGLVLYLSTVAISEKNIWHKQRPSKEPTLWLMVVLAAILAHYVEIHFGIAIAATRNLFWILFGILVVLGTGDGEFTDTSISGQFDARGKNPIASENNSNGQRVRVRQALRPPGKVVPPWRIILITSSMTSLVLGTLGYNYLSSPNRDASIIRILEVSFSKLSGTSQSTSFGIAGIILITWIIFTLILNLESTDQVTTKQSWLGILISLVISVGISSLFWIWQASRLAHIFALEARTATEVQRQVANYTNLITWYYLYVLVLILALGRSLPISWPTKPAYNRPISLLIGFATTIMIIYLAFTTNLRVIQADIAFKLADSFVSAQQWPGAIFIYQEAIKRSPTEDHYYLFLGRAYLEYARVLESETERNAVMDQAENDLQTAQKLNPLNTDHTANLARLYSWRSSVSSTSRNEDLGLAKQNYEKALSLSPNNATLWTEFAILNLNALEKPEAAREAAEYAKQLDSQYDRAYAVLGDFYFQKAQQTDDPTQQTSLYSAAIDEYSRAIQVIPIIQANYSTIYSYYAALGNVFYDSRKFLESANAYESAYQYSSENNRWRVAETIAKVYMEARNSDQALAWIKIALGEAPENAHESINQLMNEIEKVP